MAYSLSNKCAENLSKRAVLVQLIIENMVTFFGTQCTGCGKIKDPTTKTAISLKRHNNFK